MHKTILILLLLGLCSSAAADWVKLTGSGSDTDSYYADPTTKRKASNRVKIWSLVDHAKELADSFGKSHLSEKVQWEFDCTEEQKKMLAYTTYAENQGRGKAVYNDPTPGKWEAVPRGTIQESLWKFACGKK